VLFELEKDLDWSKFDESRIRFELEIIKLDWMVFEFENRLEWKYVLDMVKIFGQKCGSSFAFAT
jgi:hypothetical protein